MLRACVKLVGGLWAALWKGAKFYTLSTKATARDSNGSDFCPAAATNFAQTNSSFTQPFAGIFNLFSTNLCPLSTAPMTNTN